MADGPTDPRWPKILSLSAHELRSPLSVVAGYISILLKDGAGPLSDGQRRLLEEAQKSCGRLKMVVDEMSDLSQLESGTAPLNRGTVLLHSILAETIASLPELQDRIVTIDLTAGDTLTVRGDAVRLSAAFSSILHALRRELVTSDHLIVQVDPYEADGRPSLRTTIGEAVRMDTLLALKPSELTTFDEWRGGSGLGLPSARRIIEAHGGRLWGPVDDGKSTAIVTLPRSPSAE